jgi:O-antigen/teichoic acid export membrane protein
MEELKRSYAISTKWCFIGTLPIFFVLFLFPDVVLNLLFGSRYIGAAVALQILAFGFIFNSYFGTNYHTLIAVGKSKFIMYCHLASSVTNISLNLLLIPSFGIKGAAIASALSFAGVTILETIKLHRSSGIHPFTKNYLKITVLSILTVLGFYVILKALPFISYLTILIFFPLFLIIYGSLIIFTKSLDKEDIEILLEIKKRTNINLTRIKKILMRFM